MFEHFIAAQDPVYATVLAELRAGRKQTHWMWFIFPQLKALGRSPTAKFYGIEDLEEARAYLEHAVLGPRLRQMFGAFLHVPQGRVGRGVARAGIEAAGALVGI